MFIPGLYISLGIFKKVFDELEEQYFELDKKIRMKLAVRSGQLSEENSNEKILTLRAAQQHRNQAIKQFHENANTLQELLNLQSLHSGVIIMPTYITAMQTEIAKLLHHGEQEVKEILIQSPYTNNMIHLSTK